MDINSPLKDINIDENAILNNRNKLFENYEEISIIKENNKSKLSIRKKNNNEYLAKKRKDNLKKLGLFIKIDNLINYDELLKQIPNEIMTEFSSTKDKYSFFLKYLSFTENEDPNYYIRMFVIYQIHLITNNDILSSSIPSYELLRLLIHYLFVEYNKEQIIQKIQIQSEIIQMLIIWVFYIEEDKTNSLLYDNSFIFILFDMINNNIYNIEFKINILILFNVMIKGIKYEIIKKIELVLSKIQKEEQYIFVFRLISNIFNKLGDNDDIEMLNNNKENEGKIILFQNTYDKFIFLLNHYYGEYKKRYDELKKSKTPISMDPNLRIYYKIVIKILRIIDNSLFIEDNIFYINIIINNKVAIPLFLKIIETFNKEFFSPSYVINDKDLNIKINNTILEYNPSLNIKENNNLFKKFKVISFITHIFTEIISSKDLDNTFKNFSESYEFAMNLIMQFNIINYYSNLVKNIVSFDVKPDNMIILRIEEFIYNFGELNRNNYFLLYKNYELIRELLLINEKHINEDSFDILIKFIVNSIKLYEKEITSCLIFDIKIISNFLKFLENELENNNIKYKNKKYIFYILKQLISSDTYRKCQINWNLILNEFYKNNANKILEQYALIYIDPDEYNIINDLIINLDESDQLDYKQIENLYN